jgi:hypothetical protein
MILFKNQLFALISNAMDVKATFFWFWKLYLVLPVSPVIEPILDSFIQSIYVSAPFLISAFYICHLICVFVQYIFVYPSHRLGFLRPSNPTYLSLLFSTR